MDEKRKEQILTLIASADSSEDQSVINWIDSQSDADDIYDFIAKTMNLFVVN
jgi:hypothetical protein